MPPENLAMQARVSAMAFGQKGHGQGQIKKVADSDVRMMSLAVADASASIEDNKTLNPDSFTEVWREDFTSGFGKVNRVWGDVKLVNGTAVLTSTDPTPATHDATDWQPAGMMVPPVGASAGNGYGLYTLRAWTDFGEGPGPFAALWPSTDKWPGPEIDILEKKSKGDTDGYSTVHRKIEDGTASGRDGYDIYEWLPGTSVAMSQPHVYAMEWTATSLTLFIDNKQVFSTTKNVPKSFADGGQNSAFGVGMQPAWAWQNQNGNTNVIHVDWMSYSAPVVVEPPPPPPPTPPNMTVSDASVAEAGGLVFTVTLSAVSSTDITVNYATADGTAGSGSDYTAASGTLTIAAGQTSGTVTVATTDDSTVEQDETVLLNLSGATGANITDAQATGTITNNDVAPVVPAISVGDATLSEGGGSMRFNVSLSAATSVPVTVNYGTAGDTATLGTDFTAKSGTLTFAPGVVSQPVDVAITNDTLVEPNETLFVNLSGASNATIADAQGVGTITNDDTAPAPTPGLSVSDASVNEGGILNFVVSLSSAAASTVTVNYGTVAGTASAAGADYTAKSGALSFTAGELSKTVTVQTTDDRTVEANETMTLRLTSPVVGATLTDANGVGTILNNDTVAGRTINGTTSNNTLTGGAGDDTITGGRGNDTMTGAGGADDFVFSRFDGFDRIRDFATGVDDIVLRSIAPSTVRAVSTSSGVDLRYGPSGDHVLLEGVQAANFSITNDVIFA